jgi:hypothetical protein
MKRRILETLGDTLAIAALFALLILALAATP